MYLSADCHIMEPEDLFTRQLPEVDKFRAPIFRRLPDGTKIVFSNGIPSAISPEYVRPVNGGEETEFIGPDDVDGYLSDLALDGVRGGLLHGNAGLKIFDIDDPEFALRCAQIYNDHVFRTYASDQLFPTAVIPLSDIKRAVVEIQRVAELGFRALSLPMQAPPEGPYFSKRYDELWEAVSAVGLLPTMHVGSGIMRGSAGGDAAREGVGFLATSGSTAWPTGHPDHSGAIVARRLMTGGFGGYGGPVLSTLPALLGAGVFERFPSMHLLFVEVGARWLLNMMDTLDEAWYVGPGVKEVNRTFFRSDGSQVHQFLPDELNLQWPYPLKPSEYIRRQVHFTFQDDWIALRNRTLTGIEPLVWGNDYPHYEGTFPKSKEAVRAQAERAALTTEEQAAIFGGTLARLLGMAQY
jgi:predicted TIM-barrel fold metal-dependent hydrolase